MHRLESWIRLLRIHHWIKNAFVFAPLLFAGMTFDLDAWVMASIAFGQFCLAASTIYVFNDLRDLEADRLHPAKSIRRPLASGAISERTGWVVLGILALLFGLSFLALPSSGTIAVAYVALNLLYSLGLKKIPILDIFSIAIGFVLRVYAGALAIDVPVSGWMFITVLSLALFLAVLKRRQEATSSGVDSRDVLRVYTPALLDRYAQTAAIGALVFYCLYVVAERPVLTATVPLVLFGLFRYWYVVEIHDRGESPTEALYKDAWLSGTVLSWVLATALLIQFGATDNV